MYDFHYNCIKQKYGSKAKLLFTDTGGLSYEKKLKMCINTFGKKDKFDNSEYPENSPYFDKTNKKGIGKFEDDGYGIPLVEFIGLGSKMCFYMKDNHKGGKTAKGIRKMSQERTQTWRLWNSSGINKILLSFDGKCYIHENGIKSYNYGHYST